MNKTFSRVTAATATCEAIAGGLAIAQTSTPGSNAEPMDSS